MFKKIGDFFKTLFLALPYGLKAADVEILSQQGSSSTDNIGIRQMIQDKRVAPHLLQGEVTQEVEELRYRDYKAYNESKHYEYVGNGEVKKKDSFNTTEFVQNNIHWSANVLETLEQNEKELIGDKLEKRLLDIEYSTVPKMPLEKYCDYVKVNLDAKTIMLHFGSGNGRGARMWRIFTNWLKRISTTFVHSDIYKLFGISFTTYKANGEDDFVNYVFSGLKGDKIQIKNDHDIEITYAFQFVHRDSVLERFKSETLEEKYQKKEAKVIESNYCEINASYYCSMCGKEMNRTDAHITSATYGYPICQECLEPIIKEIEKID